LKEIDMLSDYNYINKLDNIKTQVKNLWQPNMWAPLYFTIHNQIHNDAVEKAVKKILPKDRCLGFSEKELFYLLASAWLHDIGMIPELFKKKEKPEIVRKTHHIRSGDYIKSNYNHFGLSSSDANIIAQICFYHRRSEDITKCQEDFAGIKMRLLAAYLRLADAICIGGRMDESLLKIYLELGMPIESKFHWLKSCWVYDVEPKFDELKLTIHFSVNEDDSPNVKEIIELIKEEVQKELRSVKDILIRGRMTYFLDVEENLGPGLTEQDRIELEQMIGNIKVERKASSATEVVKTFVDSILLILDLPDIHEAYSTIKAYQKQVIKNMLDKRPCHMLVKLLYNIIEANMGEELIKLDDSQIQNKVIQLKNEIVGFNQRRESQLRELYSYTNGILADNQGILLFGYSNMVIEALRLSAPNSAEKTKVYVCECRNKNNYNEINELVYCDGLEYASKIKDLGYKNVYILPDILVGNLMSRKLVKKVIYGANGIDIRDNSRVFGHTAGHLAIADLAHNYDIPVYVLIDSYKFGEMEPNPNIDRERKWLSGENKIIRRIGSGNGKIKTFNPREDVVPIDKIYALITDYGIFPPHQIPEELKNRK